MAISLKDYWPRQEHCDECLITEAETADAAVFLAVHQPMRLTRRSLQSRVVSAEMEMGESSLSVVLRGRGPVAQVHHRRRLERGRRRARRVRRRHATSFRRFRGRLRGHGRERERSDPHDRSRDA